MASLGIILRRRGLAVLVFRDGAPLGESLGILAEAQHLAFLSNKVPLTVDDILVFGPRRFRVLGVKSVVQGKDASHVEHYEVRIEPLLGA